MAIKINKELPYSNQGDLVNTGATLTHWLVTKIVEDDEKEQVLIKLIGFDSGAKRNEGLHPMPKAVHRYLIKDVIEVDPETSEETVISNLYTKWNNRKLTDEEVALRNTDADTGFPIIRAQHIRKSQVMWFLGELPEFDGLVEE